ncbi:SGNH hydrolase [Trametes punicea]|nr:SGNH hydrolase [Trametes punicea]
MAAYAQDVIMLLGDSLTQRGFDSNGFATRLANAYIRKMDVLNRGFSGYNTDWIKPVFEQCFAVQHEQQHVPKVRLLVIWFGANDAALPHSPQHVPLPRYKSNLAALAHAVRSPQSPRYSPDTRVVLVTPPPVQPARWARERAVMDGQSEVQAPDRSLEESRKYAEATREVATAEGVAVVDVWTKVWEAAGRDENGLGDFLSDGLHLNEKGFKVVYDALVSTIAENYPEYHYDRLQSVFVEWEQIASNPGDLLNLTKKRDAFAT